MDSTLVLSILCACACLLALVIGGVAWWLYTNKKKGGSGSSATPPTSVVTSPTSASSSRVVAPFLLLSDNASLKSIGSKAVVLAFVVGYKNGDVVWDSTKGSTAAIKKAVSGFKSGGRDVILSFGGETASMSKNKTYGELAGSITDTQKLADAYLACADAIGVSWIDFDVEEELLKANGKNDVINNRRAAALKIVQTKRPNLKINFTLPMEIEGIPADARRLCTNAINAGVKLHTINLMSMFYGDVKTVKSIGNMANVAMKAAAASKPFVVDQLKVNMGVTVLAGKNTVPQFSHENFTLENATQLGTLAKQSGYISFLSFWKNDMKNISSYAKNMSQTFL